MGVGHVGEVSNRARSSRDAAAGDDGREHEGKPKSGMVHGQNGTERDPQRKSCGYGGLIDYGARRKLGRHDSYCKGAGRTDGLPINGMEIGNGSAVSCGSRGAWYTSSDDDLRATCGEPEPGMVGRCWVVLETFQHLAGSQPTWDRVHVADSAWGEHGTGLLYRTDSAWAHRVRGDGMDIRNVGAMSHEPQQQGNSAADNDGRGTIGQRESRVVGGRGGREHDTTVQ